MGVDYLQVIDDESRRLRAAYAAAPAGRVPWSDRWSVNTVARHVAGTHHVVADVVAGRPHADFGLFASLAMPAKGDPGFTDWFAESTDVMLDRLRTTDADDECWSWDGDSRTVGFWARRMAQETLVHRWDAEAGAGGAITPMDPVVASDGLDEYTELFVRTTRALAGSPAGPSIGLAPTDVDDSWRIDLPEPGARVVERGRGADADVVLRGSAEGVLLVAWGRLDAAAAGVRVEGDAAVVARWSELIPPM